MYLREQCTAESLTGENKTTCKTHQHLRNISQDQAISFTTAGHRVMQCEKLVKIRYHLTTVMEEIEQMNLFDHQDQYIITQDLSVAMEISSITLAKALVL